MTKHPELKGTCETKRALLKAYQTATMAYADTVLAFKPTKDVNALRSAEEAERDVAVARRDLKKHIAEHGC